jgi:alkylation response protein AidB-like acyl-CoA dehydrogenase
VIEAAGYGDYFVHRTGHGIGLETHEEPYIVTGNTETARAGDGLLHRARHLPAGQHGARIEDIVVCGETGAERVNLRPRELVVSDGALVMPADRMLPTRRGGRTARARAARSPRRARAARSRPSTSTTALPARGVPDARQGRPALARVPEEWGGGGQPYEVYLQVLEELAGAWLSVGIGVSVHTLACTRSRRTAPTEQKQRWLPDMLGGDLLGAYCLSEPQSGSDAAALETRAVRDGDDYVVDRHQGVDHPRRSGRLLQPAWSARPATGPRHLVPARRRGDAGAVGGAARAQDGRRRLDDGAGPARRRAGPADRLIGAEGQGFEIAMTALDSGRLGIAACAVGLAQAALDAAVEYAKGRGSSGAPIGEFQGPVVHARRHGDAVSAARATYLGAARLRDAAAVRRGGGDGQAASRPTWR